MKILVIDGYDTEGMASITAAGASKAGKLYKRMLSTFISEDSIDIAEISHAEPAQLNIADYDGVCWTGSNLFFSSTNAIVERHITLCRAFFEAGIPQFGSCWAAQLATQTAGGSVISNPKGREFGIARKILLTDAGKAHPMFSGKQHVFDGFASHGDIVGDLPEGATILAGNAFSPVQAITVLYAKGEFWAVQYHPEYDFHEVASLALAREKSLTEQGIFHDARALNAYVQDMKTLNSDLSRSDLAWKLGVDEDLQSDAVRTQEVQNWLRHFFNI